jgi:hypothetical protein
MTNEQLDDFIRKNEAQVVSVLRAQGYYAEKKVTQPTISADNLVTASVRFVDVFGIPQAGVKIIFNALPQNRQIVDNNITYNIGSSSAVRIITTNVDGLANIKLVKGSSIFFTIEQSDIKRKITVPNSDFQLLDIEADVADSYSNPAPPYTALIKSTP